MTNTPFSPKDCYSLVELLQRLGREGVSQLMKFTPSRMAQGDMIYFLRADIDKILGRKLYDKESTRSFAEAPLVDPQYILSKLVFNQALLRRYKVGQDEILYQDKILDMSQPMFYGRKKGDPQDMDFFQPCGIISSVHGKLYLDEDANLLYENIGSNKSKIRGPGEKKYTVLETEDIGVLMASDMLRNILHQPDSLVASIKLGFQLKPHFIVRITVQKK